MKKILTRNIYYIFILAIILSGFSLNSTFSIAVAFDNPHGNYEVSTAGCAACHSLHASDTASIINQASQKEACYLCHDGSNSLSNIRSEFGEETVGSSVYASYHPVPDNLMDCANCHDPHLTASVTPSLLSVGSAKVSSGNAVCGTCHGSGSELPGGDIITPFTDTPHDIAATNPESGTQIKCSRCHQPHGSPYTDLIRTTIMDQEGVLQSVTGNDNTACFGCHTDITGNYFGKAIYEQTEHGTSHSSSRVFHETTQNHFSQGVLTRVVPLSHGELTLAGNMGLSFNGGSSRVNLTSSYTAVQNAFTYEFWTKPLATITLRTESTTATNGGTGQRYAIGAENGGDGGGAGVGVSVGTNGISIYERATSYFTPLLVHSATINDWVHVAVVYNNKVPSLYINGEFCRTGLTSPKSPFPSNTFGYPNGWFNGQMDDVRIWNYARSQAQIQTDMYKELAGTESGLIGYWKFNEGTGTTVNDSAGTNNGTTVATTWSTDSNRFSVTGNRVSPEYNLPASTAYGSRIFWQATEPVSTSLTLETDLFLSGSWQGWQPAINGEAIPGLDSGIDVTGGKIKYRTNLSTTNTAVTPRLQEVTVDINHVPVTARPTYPETSYQPSQCMNCHEPHGKTGISFYRRADDNTLCMDCHDHQNNDLSKYSYQGIDTYNLTPHSEMGPIPNPELYTNPVMSPGYCVICHNPHGKNDGSGIAIAKQLQLPQQQLCFGGGSGCHSDPVNSTIGVNIQDRFTAGINPTARHSINPDEQSAQGTRVECVNCHNPHLNTAANKLIDPYNRNNFYDGLDTGIYDYVGAGGEVYLMVKARHDGIPPNFTTGPTIANMADTSCRIDWGTNEVTSGVLEWGPTPALGNTIHSSFKTAHSVNLTGLTLFQNYYYKIKAVDALGNFIETEVKAFDETPPVITSGPSIANAMESSADIIWTTNEGSTSFVDYGKTVDYAVYGYVYTAGSNTRVASHTVSLLGLEPGEEYTYRVRSMDNRGNETISANFLYRLSAPPSVPSDLSYTDPSTGVDTSTITLNWSASTDPDGDSVRYYVQTSRNNTFTSIINQGYTDFGVTNWQVTVTNPDTVTYYWRVRAVDEGGAQSAYASSTFVHTGTTTVESCPILYTWDGTKFRYVTDIVAGSNIGLQMSPGKYLKPVPNEQVAIPGELLQEKNGQYIIKLKNEQNEVDFIDNLILQAVDHPIGAQIALNDFVRSTQPYQVYTYTENLRPVKRATYTKNPTWSGGEKSSPVDVTELLSRLDNKHVVGSLFDDDQIELDLGDLSKAKEIKVVVTGWTEFAKPHEREQRVKKAAEGINTAPRLLEILQPDGSWKSEEIRHIPGYTKTMVIDLNGKFPAETKNFVIRLRGLYRPHIDFIGVDTSKQEDIQIVDLELISAKLSYDQPSEFQKLPAPYFDYNNKRSDNLWVHEGNFTRYGDVLPLVEDIDDKLVVMDTGDELTVSFKALPPPAPGMTRSFVLKPWAYYKELSEAKVEPMPFRAMDFSNYPESLGEYPEELQEYVKEWNTRVHKADSADEPGFLSKVKAFFTKVYDKWRELWQWAFSPELQDEEDLEQLGDYNPTPEIALSALKLEGHYSLNTDFVVLHTDDTLGVKEYNMESAGAGMWESDSEPTPDSPGSDGSANLSRVISSNDNRWATDFYTTPNQDDGEYNYQMYRFVVTDPIDKLYSFRVSWEGFGEPTTGYNVSINFWNFAESRWDQFYNQLVPSEKTFSIIKARDYKPYCYNCHSGNLPDGVLLGPYDKNIATSFAGDFHGGGTGSDDLNSTIKEPYARGVSVPCADCHDLHGSGNAYHLRENVNGQTGISVPNMTYANKTDTSNNAAILAYCQSCHIGTLDSFHIDKCLSCHRAVGYNHEGWVNTSPQGGDFGWACNYCHTHGGYMPAHGAGCGHCYLNYDAKAF